MGRARSFITRKGKRRRERKSKRGRRGESQAYQVEQYPTLTVAWPLD